MIITFSQKFFAPDKKPTLATAKTVSAVVERVSVQKYRLTWPSDSPIGNLLPSITWSKGRRVRFTIETRDAYKHGSRTAASGRHMRKASWEAHRDVMEALFKLDPDATIKTALATYRGKADFEVKFPATASHNVGSLVHPRAISDNSI